MSDPHRVAIRRVTTKWRNLGWRPGTEEVLAVAEILLGGGDPQEAARRVSPDFIAQNGTTRQEIAESLVGLVEPLPPEARPVLRVVLLTAIRVEYLAVRSRLSDLAGAQTSHGTRYEVGGVDGARADVLVALAEIGAGNLGSAAEVVTAVAEFDPAIVMFVGIAGALDPDAKLGSVVIASRVHHYEPGRDEEGGFRPRPASFPSTHRLEQAAREVARLSSIDVVVAPIAAGEKLVGHVDSETAALIRQGYSDAKGVDMESAGLYSAAHRLGVPVLAVRGFSDHLGDKGSRNDKVDQPVAAANAAQVAMDMLRTLTPADLA